MSEPRNATTNSDGSRTYTWTSDGKTEIFTSVTTIIGDAIPKKALTGWAAREAAKFAVDHMDVWLPVRDAAGPKAAIDLIKTAPYRVKDDASERGTKLHDYAEALALGIDLPESAKDVPRHVQWLREWIQVWQPSFIASEFTVYNRSHGWAGTADFLATFAGRPAIVLGDYKTSKFGKQGHGIYPETALQLNAYANGEFIGIPDGTEAPMPEIDELLAINITERGYRVVPIEKSEALYLTFRHAIEVAKFQQEGRKAVGRPLPPPSKGAMDEAA